MKCNPWRWLWGLVPLLGLGWLMQLSGAFSDVEAALKRDTEAALHAAGHPWANVSFSGRDGTLIGEALEKSDQLRAGGIGRSVWGVRVLDDVTRLLDEEKNYVWAAQLQRDGRLRLTGFVPSAATRQAVLGAAKATFPSRDVEDRMKLARGAPAGDVWEGAIGYGLKQLAALKPGGRVDLEANNFLIEGEAQDLAAYKGVKTALQAGLPQGIKLRADKVTPPVVKPYTWSAKVGGGQVRLSGFVPSERARDDIFAAAKRAFPRHAVVDQLQVAAGEAKDWLPAVIGSIARLGRLEDGSVEFHDQQVSVTGLAADEATASDIRRGLRSDVPPAFKMTEAIRVKEIPLPTIDPFVTGVFANAGTVTLTGHVPSPAARAALLAAVRQRLPGLRIDDKLELANGAPDAWQNCVMAGVGGLGRLGGGRMQISGRAVTLGGATDDEALAQALPNEVQAAVGTACTAEVRVNFTGISAAELKRRADAAAAQATADEAARKAAQDAAAAKAAEEAARQAAAAAAAAARPPVPATVPQARIEADHCQTMLRQVRDEGVINFKRASADLDRASHETLNRIADVMATCKSARIEIQGHTDAEGTPERNANLSNRRANSVLNYLIRAGADGSRLTAVGYGETMPIAPNDTSENRAKNRRIEFEVKAE